MPPFKSIISAALSFLVFAFGISDIALEKALLRNWEGNATNTGGIWPDVYGAETQHGLLMSPGDLGTGVTDAIFASAAMAIVCGAFSFVVTMVAMNHSSQGLNPPHGTSSIVNFALCVASTATTFAIFIYAFVAEYTSSNFHYTDNMSSGQHFTRESWACQMKAEFSRSGNYWTPMCGKAKAARWMLLPLLICLATLTTLTYFVAQFRPSTDIELTARAKVADTES